MNSLISLLALAMAAQAEAPPPAGAPAATAAPAAAPALPTGADDPIGALINAAPAAAPPAAPVEAPPLPPAQPRATTRIPVPEAQAPDAAAPAQVPAAPPSAVKAAPFPYGPRPAVPAPSTDDDEEGAPLPDGPRPYNALPSSPGTVRPIRPQPLVRLPPKPQGAMDGGWLLSQGDGGSPIYQFQFNDVGGGSEIEGAWRDLRRKGVIGASGTVSSVGYDGASLTIRFLEDGRADASVVTLHAAGADWTGEIVTGGQRLRVTMRRY